MNTEYTIHKAGGVLVRDRKLLVERSKGKDVFIAPGGKVESEESAVEALIRELYEEFLITVDKSAIRPFGTYYADAAGKVGQRIRMDVFYVDAWAGTIVPSSEVEEVLWVGSTIPEGITLGSIFEHNVLPKLISENLVD